MSDFTIVEFMNRFPSDDACLEHLMDVRFGLPGASLNVSVRVNITVLRSVQCMSASGAVIK